MAKEPPRPTLSPAAAALAATWRSMTLFARIVPSTASINLFSLVLPKIASLVIAEITRPRTGVMEIPPAEPALAFRISLFVDSAATSSFWSLAPSRWVILTPSEISATESTPMTAIAMPAPTPALAPAAPLGLLPSAVVLNFVLLLASNTRSPLPILITASLWICA